jgi:hypothetical protein
MKTHKLITLALAILASCTPTAYEVDVRPYAEQVKANPSEVLIKPEHVKEIGGFQLEAGVEIESEYGAVNISERGVSTNLLVDLRDAPKSNSHGGK